MADRRSMQIGETTIGIDPPYIIAEIGVNHDGRADRARGLVEAAADCGADAVKFQFFDTGLLLSADAGPAAYQLMSGHDDPRVMLRELELSLLDLERLITAAHRRGLHAIVTVFSLEHVAPAARLGWDAFKVASPDIIHRPLMDAVSRCGLPVIVSTGASDASEVTRAVSWLENAGADFRLMQCVSAYPTPHQDAGVDVIPTIASLSYRSAGYSDHTPNIATGREAVECGAVILEKHLTYDREATGPDHAASLDPGQFATYVDDARSGLPMLGQGTGRPKKVLAIEADVRRVSRQSLVAVKALPAGHVLRRSDLTIKRPGTGIQPWQLDAVIGQPLIQPVGDDQVITLTHVALAAKDSAHAA